jgi:hypothetical protein
MSLVSVVVMNVGNAVNVRTKIADEWSGRVAIEDD